MAKRGRPKGYKLSEVSKKQISISKTGCIHSEDARRKISESLKAYFASPKGKRARQKMSKDSKARMKAYMKTEKGKAQVAKMRDYLISYWSSEDGEAFKDSLGKSMKEYYEDNFDQEKEKL